MEGFAKMWMTAPFVGAYPTIESLCGFPAAMSIQTAIDIMVRKVITTHPQASVSHVAKQLVDNDISALPVIDDAGRVVGIISEA
jgi:CBS domain-containing protein